MGAASLQITVCVGTTKIAAQKRFRGYKGGQRKKVGKAEVKDDVVLQQLRDAWERLSVVYGPRGTTLSRWHWGPTENYTIVDEDRTSRNAISIVKDLKYTPEDVARFCTIMPEYQEEKDFSGKAGLFLSALINSGHDSEYTIRTSDLPIDYLGFKNKKKITVIGNCGFDIGIMMEGGELHIHGEVGHFSNNLRGKVFLRGELIKDI